MDSRVLLKEQRVSNNCGQESLCTGTSGMLVRPSLEQKALQTIIHALDITVIFEGHLEISAEPECRGTDNDWHAFLFPL